MSEEIEMSLRSTDNMEGKKKEDNKEEEDDNDDDDDEEEDEDEVHDFLSESKNVSVGQKEEEEKPLWNRFVELPKEAESISMADTTLIDVSITIVKLTAYIVTFCGVLFGATLSKILLLLMTSQLSPNKTVTIKHDGMYFVLTIPDEERYLWIWALFASFIAPEIGTFIRSLRHVYFKNYVRKKLINKSEGTTTIVVLVMESLHVIGMALLAFQVLPNIDAIRGIMLTNCVCLVPAVLSALSYDKTDKSELKKIGIDFLAILFQLSGYLLWPVLDIIQGENNKLWYIPPTLFLISCGWWMNYVLNDSKCGWIRALNKVKKTLKHNDITLYHHYIWISLWKMALFAISAAIILNLQGIDLSNFFKSFNTIFDRNRTMDAFELEKINHTAECCFFAQTDTKYPVPTIGIGVGWLVGTHILSSYFCYGFSKYSYKIMISSFSFAFPVIFVVPLAIQLIVVATGLRNDNPGFFNSILYEYVFFNGPNIYSQRKIFIDQWGWVWILWLISQVWITLHVWMPKCERMSRTEKLFATPMYSSYLVDQSILLNRRRDKLENKAETTNTPHIIACATMWHESRVEMLEMLKSVMRMDMDQGYRMEAKNTFGNSAETNCYTYETHVFFDDAFTLENGTQNVVINTYVKNFMGLVSKAARDTYQRNNVFVLPPKKTASPYGGRLIYTLPCHSKLYVHLKNKDKIRHRKRWSQVMYMYYLLGYNLMQLESGTMEEKLEKARNIFLLALDGDIDFKPQAVLLLVDLMKKNPNLGAACGRIHPIGSGIMVWYQEFEYAIGHWLQKATEHMIGCVLCSPGCFSLFRAKALMEENVMKTYTTKAEVARHYVQYDQGEDRWLCSLLLQRGYRVEYCAASDAYTHCPESFNEFYTQRRRWGPSTMANIIDLLYDYKKIIKINNDISILYIAYQLMLLIGTVLGPGTIFLLLVSAFNAAFKIDNWTSFLYNLIPIILYMCICLTMTEKIQIISALILSGIYGLIMMAVLVGMLMQISEDGLLAPSTIFLLIVAGEIIVAGLIHPQEILCLLKGPIYYVTIPSMYLLLIIYSVCNLNVVVWGTREVKEKKTKAELEQEEKEAEENKEEKKRAGGLQSILRSFGKKGNKESRGAIEFSLGNLFKCMLFTNPKTDSEGKELTQINESLGIISKRLESIEKNLDETGFPRRPNKSASKTSMCSTDGEIKEGTEQKSDTIEGYTNGRAIEQRNDLANPYWIEDKILEKSQLTVMDIDEVHFWRKLIEEYLEPLLEDKEKKKDIARNLRELRDKMVVTFFMLNSLFVVVVFLLQLNKEQVHINWPLDARINMTATDQEIRITKTHLQLEPVGVLFIVFFSLILIVQFLAMLCHRFETLSHLLSSSSLSMPWKNKSTSFEKWVKMGKQKFLKENLVIESSTLENPRTQPLDVKVMTESIFSEMKHKEELEMAEKAERRKTSIFRRFNPVFADIQATIRSRNSNFRSMRLENVVEEGSE